MIDAGFTRYGFHLHIGHPFNPWFMVWCLWHQDAGITLGRYGRRIANIVVTLP